MIKASERIHTNFSGIVDVVDGLISQKASGAKPPIKLLKVFIISKATITNKSPKLYFGTQIKKTVRRHPNLIDSLLDWTESSIAITAFSQQNYLRIWLKNGLEQAKNGVNPVDAFQFGTAKQDGTKKRGQPKKAWTLAEDLQRLAWLYANINMRNCRRSEMNRSDWTFARKSIINARMVYEETGLELVESKIDAATKSARTNDGNIYKIMFRRDKMRREALSIEKKHGAPKKSIKW